MACPPCSWYTGAMSETSLRRSRLGDIDPLAELHVRSWQVGYQGLIPADLLAGLDPGWRARQRRESWGDPDHSHVRELVAERDGRVVGFVSHGPYRTDHEAGWRSVDPSGGGEVYGLYVHPDHWGVGVGGRLLEAAVADLLESRLTPVRVWTLHGNTRAIRFYQRHGFVRDGVTQPIRLGPHRDLERIEERMTLPTRGSRSSAAPD